MMATDDQLTPDDDGYKREILEQSILKDQSIPGASDTLTSSNTMIFRVVLKIP